jgi:hypothetical protein
MEGSTLSIAIEPPILAAQAFLYLNRFGQVVILTRTVGSLQVLPAIGLKTFWKMSTYEQPI